MHIAVLARVSFFDDICDHGFETSRQIKVVSSKRMQRLLCLEEEMRTLVACIATDKKATRRTLAGPLVKRPNDKRREVWIHRNVMLHLPDWWYLSGGQSWALPLPEKAC